MAIKVLEADSDYINVGNIMLPLDASEYGYDSYDAVRKGTQAKYDKEKEAERQEAERQAKEKEKQDFIASHKDELAQAESIINDDSINPDEKLEALFDISVPSTGSADTVGGEIVRAINRLDYRFFNDGDFFCDGYGLETCGADAAYLADTTNDTIATVLNDAVDRICGTYYSTTELDQIYKEFLETLKFAVIEYLRENINLFAEANSTDSRIDYDSPTLSDWDEKAHSLDYEVSTYDLPAEWDTLVDAGRVSDRDFYDFCDGLVSWGGFPGEVTQPYRDAVVVTNLDREGFDQWEREFSRELDAWMEDLINENADILDDEEEF